MALIFSLAAGAGRAAEIPESLDTCSRLKHDPERLACYDQAIARLRSGENAAAAPSAENMFGAGTAARPAPAPHETPREELKQISAAVTSLKRTDDGMIVVALDNGQSWRQQDSDISLTLEVGDTVTIMRAALGTFRITDKRGRSARFRRVR